MATSDAHAITTLLNLVDDKIMFLCSMNMNFPYPKYVYVIDPDSTAICTIGKEKKTPHYWFTSTGSKTAISKSVTNILIGWEWNTGWWTELESEEQAE